MTRKVDPRRDLGRRGEELAVAYLLKQGYHVLARNWRARRKEQPLQRGEIDIVAQEGEWLVFVEVRTRRRGRSGLQPMLGAPEESVVPRKQQQLIAMAEAYLYELPWEGPWRIDVMALELDSTGAVARMNHLRDAVSGR